MDSSESDGAVSGSRRGLGGRQHALDSDDDDIGELRGGLGFGAVLGAGGRRKRRASDDGILGVFADGGPSDDDRPRGKGRKKGKRSDSPSKPVNFVKGNTLNKTHVPKPVNNDESDDDIPERFRLDATASPEVPGMEQGPKLPARNSMSFNQMSGTYGKGFAMLQKMGFKGGGLGRNEDGIANPIEVQVRKGKQGLQDEGEMVDQDLYGRDGRRNRRSVEELLASKATQAQDQTPSMSESWKKGAPAKKPRTVYKTASEVASEPKQMRIIDMRGPEVRIASSFSELATSMSGDSVKSLKELRHNTRLLVAKYEDKIRALAEKKKHYEDLLISVGRESEQLKAASSLSESDLRRCRIMVTELEELRERQDAGSIGLKELGEAFTSLRKAHPREFQAVRASEVATAFAVPVAKQEVADWDPLRRPAQPFAALAPWRELSQTQGMGMNALTAVCDHALLPRLRSALTSWSVRDFEPCIRLFESCRKALPSDAVNAMVAQVVLPRLKVEVDSWDPRSDKMPIHLWIHPWLPILGDKLDCLWMPIRFKLSACLEIWDPRDRSACGMLKPWSSVFTPADWEPLMEKVLLKLEQGILNSSVRPSGQETGPVEDLLAWLDIVPLDSIARVLDTALFPQWHKALRQWFRAPECDFGEVLQWYQGWRSLLPEAVREQGLIQRQLAHGLEVMKSFMSGAASGEAQVAPDSPVSDEPSSAHQAAGRRRSAPAVEPEDVSLSLADYLAEVAGEHGLVFRPKAKVTHLGKQVYQFGSVSVYLDKNLVYAASRGAGEEWLPVAFEEVLRLAQRS